MWWRKLQRPARDAFDERDGKCLLEECESYLEGQYARRLARDGCPVPAWAWINLLAHGSRQELESLARAQYRWSQAASIWPTMAAEVIRATDRSGQPLVQLQRRCLVPLEVQILRRGTRLTERVAASNVAAALGQHLRRIEREATKPREGQDKPGP